MNLNPMKNILLNKLKAISFIGLIIVILFPVSMFSQINDFKYYTKYIIYPRPDSLYYLGEYRKSIEYNLKRTDSTKNIKVDAIYVIAQDYSLLKMVDSAFYYLNKYIDFGPQDYRIVYIEEDFKILRKNKKQWNNIINRIENIYLMELDSSMNKELALKLFRIGTREPETEAMVNFYRKKFESIEFGENQKLQKEINKIIKKYGLPSKSMVGQTAADIVLNNIKKHPIKENNYNLVKEAYEKGDYLPPKYYASLTDTWLEQNGKKQIYGTIWHKTEKTIKEYGDVYILYPVEDFKNLNEIRAEMGLSSIEEYQKNISLYGSEKHYIPEKYYNDNE